MNERYKIFPYIFIISLIAIISTLFLKGILYTVIVTISIGIILLITKSIWMPSGQGKYTVRLLSISTALAAALSYGLWQSFIEAFIKTNFPKIAENYQDVPPFLMFVFIATVLWFINYFNRDTTGMGKHQISLSKDFPELSYREEIKGIASALSDDLKSIDIRTNWSSKYFTPLDAEVVALSKKGKTKKIENLLSVIRKSNERLFLILGDPGSGKSVALRKLCQDLASEVQATGKIPIYINLKEWHENWDEKNPPTSEQLYNFVLSNIKNRDIYISKFFSKKTDNNSTTYFDRLYKSGRLYFVFDSFDEIPSVLNEREDSWLIQDLSKVIYSFLKGTQTDSSQGILASRLFRRPTRDFQTKVTLEIRPFSEKKIIQTFRNVGNFNEKLIKQFFRENTHLIPSARNPFSATLISEYASSKNKLPNNHSELFESYIDELLNNCIDRLTKHQLSKKQITSFAQTIALSMFHGKTGWEISIQELRKHHKQADNIVDILRFARIGRSSTVDSTIFGFVHRRFAEYFMVKNIIDNKINIKLDAIPTDSQLRDSLVLYCEVADYDTATSIANYTWNFIKMKDNINEKETIHCLRFLNDAFKSRK